MALEIVRGDTTFLEWVITSAVDGSGNPIYNFSNFTFRLQARLTPDSKRVLFTKSSADGSIVVSGNTVRVKLTPVDTSRLPAGEEIHIDLQAESGGNVFTVRTKEQPLRVRVLPDVTR